MKFKDYYQVLGVARDASADDIKRAYRKLARKYHPDVSKEPGAEARFKEINEANAVLQDPEKRAAYDQLGANWQQGQDFTPPPGWGGPGATARGGGFSAADAAQFSDFFAALFGEDFAGFSRAGTHTRQRPGQDRQAKIQIGVEDAYHGATRTLQLAGSEHDAHARTLQVKIPAGVTQGQHIRLSGQGTPGLGGAVNGDLYLQVELQPHPLYRIDGRDVYINLPLAPWEAALGATLTVPTLGGKVEVKIPAGAQPGQKLRLKGRGLPGKTPGDQYVVLQIVTPKADNTKAKELYARMAQELAFNPRAHLGV